MKSSMCFIYVVFVTVYFGSALGNEESNKDCPLQTSRRNELRTVEELTRILIGCLNQSGNADFRQLESLSGIGEHRNFFKNLCGEMTTARECLATESSKWNACHNETMSKVFTIFDQMVETTLRKGCENDGESYGIISEGFSRHIARYTLRNPFVSECLIHGSRQSVLVLRSEAKLATKIWFLYRGIQKFRTCSAEHIPDESLVAAFGEHLDEILDKMKCLRQEDEDLVLCKSIDASTIDRASVCPLRTKDIGLVPLSMLLDNRQHSCFIQYEPYGMVFSNRTTLEEFREYFSNYCRRYARVTHCLNETKSAAELCLDNPEFKNFELVHDYLNRALESGCFENGTRLASILHAVKMLKNNTNLRDTLLKCLAAGETSKTLSYGAPTRIYQFYQELPNVRQCLLDNAGEDTTYIEDVNGFINDMITTMKCINTLDGSIVLCQTIVENS